LNNAVTLRNQLYYYTAKREWFNSESYSFNPATGLVDRDRFFVSHDQRLTGNKAELQWDGKLAGMDNRMVATLDASKLDFVRPSDFHGDGAVTLVDPVGGTFGTLTLAPQTARIGNTALSAEDRLKVTPAFALIGGLRYEDIDVDRTSIDKTGTIVNGFPFSKSFHPATGRLGFTWETMPGFTLYSQYATAADVSVNNLFLLSATGPLDLTRSRTYEAGIKHLLWERKAEWSLAVFDIARSNVFAAQGGQTLNLAGKQLSNGAELALALRPTPQWNLLGNFAYTRARYADYIFAGVSFSGNTPPNVPKIVANAGASYRINAPLPVEIGASVRHVGDRFNTDANTVTMLAYTVADAYAFIDIQKKTRLTLRVRNVADKKYAIWGDPFYPDQILLGAPRNYELSAAVKF